MERLRKNSDYVLSLALIGIFVPLIVYILRQQFNIFAQIILILGFILLGLYVSLEYHRIFGALRGRQVRYGGNALLMIVLFIGIVALIAFLSQRYSKRIDLTASHSFSISQQSKKVLDNLPQPVKAWAFFSQTSNRADTETLLKSYTAASGGKFSYEMVDPDARPTLASQYGLTQGDTDIVVLEMGAKRQKLTGSAESDITSGLSRISSDTQKVVYLLQGHGERSTDDTSQNGVLLAQQALQGDNYVVKPLSLISAPAISSTTSLTSTGSLTATTAVTVSGGLTNTAQPQQFGKIPADAAVLVINAPQVPLLDGEWQIVSQWLNNGGKLFVLEDGLGGPTGIEPSLLADWGLRVRDDLAIDPSGSATGDPATLVIQRGDFSPITKDMRAEAIMPGARSIDVPQQTTQGTTFTPIAQTSSQSWGESDLAHLSTGVRYDPGKDTLGPLTIALTAERDAPGGAKARLALYANSRFSSDRWINSGGNLDLFVNTVNWLAEDEQLISIRAQAPAVRTLFIPPTDAKLIVFFSVAALPLLVLGLGAVVWWRRR